MALFRMERYQPLDDGEEDKEDVEQNEQAVVADLKSRLKRTKPKLDEEKDIPEKKIKNDSVIEDEVVQEKEGKKSKKKKKNKKKNLEQSDFTTLGEHLGQKRAKVRRVLPEWLANPDVVSVDLRGERYIKVGELAGLDESLNERLVSRGIESFFPVQGQVIPHLLDSPRNLLFRPGDVCVSAPTGSGKTLAFVLPLIQALKRRVVPRIRAVVVLPVQDLAAQVHGVFQSFAEGTGLKVRLLSAAKSFSQEQYELVRKGAVGWHSMADIVVATPGRLVDHVKKTQGFSLAHLRYLVIDEADRVMEDVQNDWLAVVEEAVYSEGRTRPSKLTAAEALSKEQQLPLQKLLFSATLSQNPEQLEQLRLFEPRLFTSVVKDKVSTAGQQEFVGQYTTPAELKEFFVVCGDSLKKPQVLHHLMRSKSMKRALIFTKSLQHTHSLAVLLRQYGIQVEELSSQVKGDRKRILNKLSIGSVDALVCSDALARGIDVGEVDYVLNYDCPAFARTYVHRAGRTARAGREGSAITLCEKGEVGKFKRLLEEVGKNNVEEIEVDEDELDGDVYAEAAERTKEVLDGEKKGKKIGRSAKKTKK